MTISQKRYSQNDREKLTILVLVILLKTGQKSKIPFETLQVNNFQKIYSFSPFCKIIRAKILLNSTLLIEWRA